MERGECFLDHLVLRTSSRLDSPVLLVLGMPELTDRVSTLISLDCREFITADDRLIIRIAIVVEKKGRLYSGWVTEDYLARIACHAGITIKHFEDDDMKLNPYDIEIRPRSLEESDSNPFQKHWRDVIVFPQLEDMVKEHFGGGMLQEARDLQIECSSTSGFPVVSFKIDRPFGLTNSSTTLFSAELLLQMQKLVNRSFLSPEFLGGLQSNTLLQSVRIIGQSRTGLLEIEDIFVGLDGSSDLVWLYRDGNAPADDFADKILTSGCDLRIHCIPYSAAVTHRMLDRQNGPVQQDSEYDTATVVSATLYRPIGLAGASKRNCTLLRFSIGFAGMQAYVIAPDGEIESLQDALHLTSRSSHIERIHVIGYDVVAVTSKTQLNIVVAKLCMNWNRLKRVENGSSSSTTATDYTG